ncbi:MAG: TadE family protein [Ilumatobacteraceae bacterium]
MRQTRQSLSFTESGQATVELAFIFPIILLLGAALFQFGLIVVNQLAVWDAARSAARAAAVSTDPQVAERAANDAVSLRPLKVTVTTIDDVVSAHVVYVEQTSLPLIGLFFPAVTLEASVAMLNENPLP